MQNSNLSSVGYIKRGNSAAISISTGWTNVLYTNVAFGQSLAVRQQKMFCMTF